MIRKIINQLLSLMAIRHVKKLFLKDPFACEHIKKIACGIQSEKVRDYFLLHFLYESIFFTVAYRYKNDTLISIELFTNDEKIKKIFEVEVVND